MFSSSGMKRGLAATAVSALAVAGLPFLAGSAYADSVNAQVGAGSVDLFTQYSGAASTQFDGVNRTVHLLAGGGDDVSRVRFEYDNAAGATTVIATVSRTNGVFSSEWTPPSSVLGQSVTVRAVGLSSVDTPIAGATDQNVVTVSADAAALDIANAPGSALGIFDQPYGLEDPEGNNVDHSTAQGIVTGTTSGSGAVTLRDLSAGTTPRPAATPGAPNADGVRSFRGAVDFDDYDLSGTPDEAVIGADQANGSDDAEVVNLESQTITNVTAQASPASVPNGQTSTAVITVTDAQNRPIAGAQVIFDRDKDDVWDTTDTSYYTDANGQARVTGLAGSAGGTSYTFFVNTTDGDDYDPAVDFKRTVTVSSFAQVPTRITTSSADGDAFDVDENDADDLQVTVLDQNNQGVPNQTVNYSLSVARFDGSTTPPTSTTGSVTTGAGGTANIPFTDLGDGTYTLRTYIEQNGTPGQQDGDLSGANRTFKAGDADLVFAEAPSATSVAGTTDTYAASLTLADGTPLAGRDVRFTYTARDNVVVAAQGNQPPGTTRNSDTQATGTTNAQGVVSVALSDPASPDRAELDGQLDAETIANSIGDADAVAAPLDVDFVDGTPPARSTITVFQIDEGKPGEATPGSLRVVADEDNNPNTAATPVEGLAVTLDIDQNAFFTDGTAAPGAVVGQDFRLQNLGKTITVVTDANGEAEFQTSIERDSGFDDDGEVTATITARSGSVSDSEDQVFDSSDPINGGEVVVEQSPESVQDNPVDPTRVGNYVYFDVTTTDQFGNVVGGEDYTVTPDDDDVFVDYESVSDFTDDGDFRVFSDEAGTVSLDVEWTTGTTVYVADPFGTEPVAGSGNNETLEDTAETEFYEVDFAASTFQIASSPDDEPLAVGTPVTETVTVIDQEGNPVEGLFVQFLRQGPGDQTGDTNSSSRTNANGKAFYNFVGTQEGTARISAVISENQGTEPIRTITDEVVFDDGTVEPPQPTKITATLQGANNGAKADRLKAVTTPTGEAAGAQVRLFTRNANGKRVLLAQKVLNGNGAASFSERDRNGNRATTYWVVVSRTDTTTSARSADKKVR